MKLEEGQIYEGTMSLSGGGGPLRRWIVVAPFGQTHVHSIDDPLELRCWPLGSAQKAIEQGQLTAAGTDPQHPAVRLQRVKERFGIRDAHIGLRGQELERMVELFEQAVQAGDDYASYAAGEILALMNEEFYSVEEARALKDRVRTRLGSAPQR